jgi:ribosomal protein S12 methylthiotransferase
VKELNIISQDTTWYGRDARRKDASAPLLPDLMRALVTETDVPWFRLFYMYPSGITPELVELMAGEDAILPYLDMPLQHGSDRMLEAMRRPERQAVIRERVAWLRDAVPDMTLRTTVIVGFPGESEEDFTDMLHLLEELRFDRVGAFTYSVEDGTPAADMPDQISDSLKRERLERLMDVQRMISFENNEALIGREFPALVDEVLDDPGPIGPAAEGRPVGVARTVGQALDVDGVTHVHPHDGLAAGQLVTVKIEDAEEYDLIARVVESTLVPDGE